MKAKRKQASDQQIRVFTDYEVVPVTAEFELPNPATLRSVIDAAGPIGPDIGGASPAYHKALRQLIDNALDAGATDIFIATARDRFLIRDNGTGCEAMRKFLHSGRQSCLETSPPRNSIVSGAHAMAWIGKGHAIEITSRTEQLTRKIVVDPNECIRQGRWILREFDARPRREDPRGTEICIAEPRQLYDAKKLAEKIGFLYSGVLRGGVRIAFECDGKPFEAKPYEPPPLDRRKASTISWHGRPVRIECGLVKPGMANPYSGFTFYFARRYIDNNDFPGGGFNCNRIFASVHLPDDWPDIRGLKEYFIGKGSRDSDQIDLMEAISTACVDLLRESDKYGRDPDLDRIASVLSGLGNPRRSHGRERTRRR